MKSVNKSSKGFSLVEMLVVIAIMAIVTTMAAGGMYLVRNATITGATNKLETSLTKAKGYATTVDNDETFVEYYIEGTSLMCYTGYVRAGKVFEKGIEKMGQKVTIDFDDDVSTTKYTVTKSNPIRVYFDRRSGAVSKVTSVSGSVESELSLGKSGTFTVRFTNGSGKDSEVVLYYENGTVE